MHFLNEALSRTIYVRRVIATSHADSTRMVRPEDFETDIVKSVSSVRQIENFNQYLPLCVDWKAERLVYGRWDGARSLSDVPFLYQRQRLCTKMLADIPFERLHELGCADGMTPMFIFSIGRCGSTLLSKMLSAVGENALSEPDVLTNIAHLDSAEQRALADGAKELIVRSCVESFRYGCGPAPIIKLRARCNSAADAFLNALPDARYVFMFRERKGWVQSNSRAFGESAQALASLLTQSVEAFQHMRSVGANPELVWYEDLLAHPVDTLKRILPHRAELSNCYPALSQSLRADAQAGSNLSMAALAARSADPGIVDAFEMIWQQMRPEQLLTELGLTRLL